MLRRVLDPDAIAERTPADRDRVADLLRLLAILLVVLGHWLVATVLVRDGELVAGTVLQHVPATRALTWVFQVMPLFFFVGGALNAGSWERARERGEAWPVWVRRRARRLLAPLVPVLVVWAVLSLTLQAWFLSPALTAEVTRAALLPLWFLVVYVLVVGLVPVTWWLHRRWGVWVPAAALVLTAAVDLLDRGLTLPVVGFVSYLLVWGGVHQLGYLWHDGRLPRPRAALVFAAVTAGASLALVGVGLYPGSMVAVQGAADQNTDPPSLALLLFALAQIGLVTALRDPLDRWLRRPAVWAPVVVVGSATLTLFLWHMTALALVAAAVHPTGWWPRFTHVDAGWWAMRPVWLLACGVVLAGLVAVFRRFESQPDPVPRDQPAWTLLGLAAFATGMGVLMTEGFYDPGAPANLRLVPLAAVAVGLGLLGALRPSRSLEGGGEAS
jgi:peptidoglycan/LPS O-acetylase OafA/YrhL